MATHSSILAWRIPMDRGAWRVTVHGVAKSQTSLILNSDAWFVFLFYVFLAPSSVYTFFCLSFFFFISTVDDS